MGPVAPIAAHNSVNETLSRRVPRMPTPYGAVGCSDCCALVIVLAEAVNLIVIADEEERNGILVPMEQDAKR